MARRATKGDEDERARCNGINVLERVFNRALALPQIRTATRRALVARQLLTQHLKRNIEGGGLQLIVFDAIGDDFDGQFLGIADSLLPRLPVGNYAGEFQRLRYPAT